MDKPLDTPPVTYTREEAAAAFEWLRAASLVADIHSHHAAIMFTEIARLKTASSEIEPKAEAAIRELGLPVYPKDYAPSAIAPNGWKLVPLVPTDEMEKAAYQEDIAYSNNRYTFPSESRFYNVYAAMLRTAPEAK